MASANDSKVARRRAIGRRALQVSGLGLGTAPLGGLYRDLTDEEARDTVDAAWDCGVRFFDTAPHYGHTKAEHRLGDALRHYPREDYVLSTKAGRRYVPRKNAYDGSEGWQNPLPFQAIYDYTHAGILRSFEDSQQRLGICRYGKRLPTLSRRANDARAGEPIVETAMIAAEQRGQESKARRHSEHAPHQRP